MIIIDRFEGDFAVLEDRGSANTFDVERRLLPDSAKEGDVVELQDGRYIVNTQATTERRQNLINRLRKMGL